MNNRVLHLVWIPLVVFVVGWMGWQQIKIRSIHGLPIKYVRVKGAFQYIAKDQIKRVLESQVSKGFYNADISQIKVSVNQLPWVNKVEVQRVWPDTIEIHIIEQIPIVRWGNNALLNRRGEIFIPDNIAAFTQLPMLIGVEGKEKPLLEVMKGVMLVLSDRNMALSELRVSERSAWYIKLKNNMILKLGRNKPLDKFQRFLHTFALIGEEQIAKVKVVDLRYPNGYTLEWKDHKVKIDWKKIAEMRKI